jgi:hypothetical protein
MADRIEAHTLIEKSPHEIFAFLSVPENHAKFIPGMLEFKGASPGSFAQVGAKALGLRRLLGRRLDLPYEIIESEPDKKLAMKGEMGPISYEDGYLLEPRGSGTRVTFWLRFKPAGWIWLAMPILIPWGKIHGAETAANLKRVLQVAG